MAKRYPGVRPRGNSIEVDLPINGKRRRFSINIPPNRQSFEHASNVRAAALLDIAKGTFNAAKYFPDSKSSAVTSHKLPAIKDALQSFLKDSEKTLSPSTYRDYKSAVEFHLVPYFGELTLDQVSVADIREWIAGLQISGKRINNILIPLRKIFSDAYYSEELDSNPLDRIKNLPHRPDAPDPFSLDEIEKILSCCEIETRALFQFAFWTGLRTSELIALEWCDFDSDFQRVFINKAEVRGQIKGTKTYSGMRTVQLLQPARDAVKLVDTGSHLPKTRVFINPKTDRPWSSDGQIRKTAWIHILKDAGVRYRRPYQTRHTYASQMLTLGADPMWLAQQMGHKDWGMIRRVYGRWMKDSRPDISKNIEAKLTQIGHMVP